ncbi:MAG TPA: fibrobacter succinogenes major paralogous domain-containing protein [Bacteroidales bacterium]|nr:fibrobacter succinogenes major paralogous domain-containing protein [Bacteroidales bacterium]HRZ48555.1 fibrobacter succinogenes major paralogous domain-containing protein [Bacteroidales bacterium]
MNNLHFIIKPFALFAVFTSCLIGLIFESGCKKDDQKPAYGTPVLDIEGNSYQTVIIGNQVWMAENLMTSKYNDGTDISFITETDDWKAMTEGGFCWYENSELNKNVYGCLYNWYAVETGKLCPAGWHVPSYGEWNALIGELNEDEKPASHLKEAGTEHWASPNNASNSTGFTALPGGSRYGADGVFGNITKYGNWWSSSLNSTDMAWHITMDNFFDDCRLNSAYILCGMSVRCIKN